MATWTFDRPFDVLASDLLGGGGGDVVVEVATPAFYRERAGSWVLEISGSGLVYGADGTAIGGTAQRIDVLEGGALVLRIDGIDWNLAILGSLVDPPSGEPDAAALLDYLFGRPDTVVGSPAADFLFGIGGDDLIDGREGVDAAVFVGARAAFSLARVGDGWTATDATGFEGVDTLRNVERLLFADRGVALDLEGDAGTVARLIGALFGPSRVADPGFVGIGLALLDGGMGDAELAALAIGTDVFAQLAGSRSNADFVNHVFANVVGRAPDAAERAEFVALLDGGLFTQASLALFAAGTELTAARIDLVGLADRGLDFLPFDG